MQIYLLLYGCVKLLLYYWYTKAFLFNCTARKFPLRKTFFETANISIVSCMVHVKENNILDRHVGISMNPVSISQEENRSRKILQECMQHRVLCVIVKMTSTRTSVKFIVGLGNGPRQEEKIFPPIHKSVERANLIETLRRYKSCYIRGVSKPRDIYFFFQIRHTPRWFFLNKNATICLLIRTIC